MNTDIDRLHHVVENRNYYTRFHRGVGKTFADCHELAGVLETTQSEQVICVVPVHQRIHYILSQLDIVFREDEHQIKIVQRFHYNHFLFQAPERHQIEVRFITAGKQEDRYTCGYDGPVVTFND